MSKFKNMKKIILIFASIALAAACSPMAHVIPLEMRTPSTSGLDLGGKNYAVVYQSDSLNLAQETFQYTFAQEFMDELVTRNQSPEGSAVYAWRNMDESAASKDSLVNMVIDTGNDVVIFVKPTHFITSPEKSSSEFTINLSVYDSMDKEDIVRQFARTNTVNQQLSEENASIIAKKTAKEISQFFKSQWKLQQFTFLYYSTEKWFKAMFLAEQMQWGDAIDIWLGLTKTNNLQKRAAAAYNISVACYINGDYSLALEWLDRSDKDDLIAFSSAHRRRILGKIKN